MRISFPPGLKEKYRGPFITENVKVLVGILGVLLTTGSLLSVAIAVNEMLPRESD